MTAGKVYGWQAYGVPKRKVQTTLPISLERRIMTSVAGKFQKPFDQGEDLGIA